MKHGAEKCSFGTSCVEKLLKDFPFFGWAVSSLCRPQGREQRGATLRGQAHLAGVRCQDHRHHALGQDDGPGDRGDQGGHHQGDRHPEESLRTGKHQ